METSKLFRTIWRFNAVIIACAGLLASFIFLFSLLQIFRSDARPSTQNEPLNLEGEQNMDKPLKLGRVEHLKDSDAILLPLYTANSGGIRDYSSKHNVTTHNLLFTNTRTQKSYWLFPNNEGLITQYRHIGNDSTAGLTQLDTETIPVMMYNIVTEDTNADQKLTSNDASTIALSDTLGQRYTEILRNVDELLGYDITPDRSLALVYRKGREVSTAYVDLNRFKVISEQSLPSL